MYLFSVSDLKQNGKGRNNVEIDFIRRRCVCPRGLSDYSKPADVYPTNLQKSEKTQKLLE